MTVEGKKIVTLEEFEKDYLRKALRVIKELSEEIEDDDVNDIIEGLEYLIYHNEWEVEIS